MSRYRKQLEHARILDSPLIPRPESLPLTRSKRFWRQGASLLPGRTMALIVSDRSLACRCGTGGLSIVETPPGVVDASWGGAVVARSEGSTDCSSNVGGSVWIIALWRDKLARGAIGLEAITLYPLRT